MTDNEIVKALECYRGQVLFTFNGKKPEIYIHDIIDLINRQKAEIERLLKSLSELSNHIHLITERKQAEAIKEFAERLKNASGSAVAVQDGRELYETKSYTINAMKLDNLVEEMAGES